MLDPSQHKLVFIYSRYLSITEKIQSIHIYNQHGPTNWEDT
jgi:hypothetical protein